MNGPRIQEQSERRGEQVEKGNKGRGVENTTVLRTAHRRLNKDINTGGAAEEKPRNLRGVEVERMGRGEVRGAAGERG